MGPVQLARAIVTGGNLNNCFGGMAVAYLGTGRFDPAKQALAPDSSNKLRPTNASAKRPTYEDRLNFVHGALEYCFATQSPAL